MAIKVGGNLCRASFGAKHGDATHSPRWETSVKYCCLYHSILEGARNGECRDSFQAVAVVAVLSMTGHTRSWKIGWVVPVAVRRAVEMARLPPLRHVFR
jgi:hypothetical protein